MARKKKENKPEGIIKLESFAGTLADILNNEKFLQDKGFLEKHIRETLELRNIFQEQARNFESEIHKPSIALQMTFEMLDQYYNILYGMQQKPADFISGDKLLGIINIYKHLLKKMERYFSPYKNSQYYLAKFRRALEKRSKD